MAIEAPIRFLGFSGPRQGVSLDLGEKEKRGLTRVFEYRPFASHPGSSPNNWVPTDWALSKLADLMNVGDGEGNP